MIRRRDFLAATPLIAACAGDDVIGAADIPAGILDVRAFGAAGDGRADDAGAFERALEALPRTAGVLLFPPGRYRLGRRITVPERATLALVNGALLVLGEEAGLVLRGPLSAARHRIFEGTGPVLFEGWSTDALLPEWWGAVPDGEADSSAALAACFAALEAGTVRTISFARGSYRVSTPLRLEVDGARLVGNRTQLRWTEDVDGLRLIGRHVAVRDLGLRGPGFGRSSGTGLRVQRPETWPKTTDRYELADLHVMDWHVGVRLENLELLHAQDWRIDYNRTNTELIDGVFNTFVGCRWSNAQGPVNMRVGGERGVGNSSASGHNTFIQCEWLETPADGTALILGEPGFPSPGNLILKGDFEKTRGAVAVRVNGAGNVLIAPFFHAVAGGVDAASPDDVVVIAPRFTAEGFDAFTARGAEGARVTLQQPVGVDRGRGALGGVQVDRGGGDPVLRAPDGTRYRLRVDANGALSTERLR